MIVQVISTTDGKSVGEVFDTANPSTALKWHPDKIQDIGGGYHRYSNSNIVNSKEVT